MYSQIKSATSAMKPQAITVFLYDDRKIPKAYKDLEHNFGKSIARSLDKPETKLKVGDITTIYTHNDTIKRIFIVGLGNKNQFNALKLREAAGKLVRTAEAAEVSKLSLLATDGIGKQLTEDAIGRALADGIVLGNFHFTEYLGEVNKKSTSKKSLKLAVAIDKPALNAFKRNLIASEGANTTRTLAATPPNVANPAYIVRFCKSLARRTKMKCTVIDKKKAKELNMGGLLNVGAAGSTPPALICLEHKPTKAKNKAPLLFVGKSITFDTGGYNLKPGSGITGMKYDKCGGMAVIGAMQAIAELNLPIHVVGLVAAAENMIDSSAYRPDDIIKFHNGVSCEITNTDAEGRLVLADALSYGCTKYKPAAVVDLATLTGGVVVALGSVCAGIFCNDTEFRSKVFDAADDTSERLWHLPLWEEHREMMKSNHADLANSSIRVGRECHPIQGAAFLSFFVGPKGGPNDYNEIPWAHIDIAGMADTSSDGPIYRTGPTGYGARLLTRLAENWK